MISKTVLCLLVLCTAASAYNGQYGLNAFQRPSLANLFNVKPRVRVLNLHKPQMQGQQMQGQQMQEQQMQGQAQAPQAAPAQYQSQAQAPQGQHMQGQQMQEQQMQGQAQAPQAAPAQYQQYQTQAYQAPPREELVNNCQSGTVEPIFGGEHVIETYCRCPSGTYGLTCKENFRNPCDYEGAQYYPADPSIGTHYFIECNWNTPYLFKCPAGLVWNQELTTCDWEHQRSYEMAPPNPAYPAYQAPTPAPTPAYQAPTQATPAFVAPTPAYQAPTAATPVFVAPTPGYMRYAPRNY